MKKELFGYILMLLAACIIIGCTAEIDASAASSSSANLAVILEYCLGVISLLLVLAIRIVGIAFFSFAIIEMINDQYTFVVPPIVFMIIGTLIIFIGYRSQPYEPLVRIGKLKRIPCAKTDKKKHIVQIAVEWDVGVSASLFATWLLERWQ